MTNIVAFPASHSQPDFREEANALQKEALMLLRMADRLASYDGCANVAAGLAEDMEIILARMNSMAAGLKQKAKPFMKSQAQLDAELREFERQFLS